MKINQVVITNGYLAIVKEIYDKYLTVNILFHGKVLPSVTIERFCSSTIVVDGKKKYTRDEQKKMFGYHFSTGFIDIYYTYTDHETVWNIYGDGIYVRSAKQCNLFDINVK